MPFLKHGISDNWIRKHTRSGTEEAGIRTGHLAHNNATMRAAAAMDRGDSRSAHKWGVMRDTMREDSRFKGETTDFAINKSRGVWDSEDHKPTGRKAVQDLAKMDRKAKGTRKTTRR